MRFAPGRTLATPGALAAMEEAGTNPSSLILRHLSGDWGDLSPEDKEENELSLREGFRILSAYTLPTGQKIWLISEADRSVTTFIRPVDY